MTLAPFTPYCSIPSSVISYRKSITQLWRPLG